MFALFAFGVCVVMAMSVAAAAASASAEAGTTVPRVQSGPFPDHSVMSSWTSLNAVRLHYGVDTSTWDMFTEALGEPGFDDIGTLRASVTRITSRFAMA